MEKETSGKFLKISCPRCGSKTLIYGKATTRIKCKKCNKLLVKLTGGKTKICAPIRSIIK
jgi:ribosomal protein S27E